MEKAILGKKIGMTQVFDQNGIVTPVTVILAGPCTVVQKKTVDKDGYDALVVAFEEAKEKNKSKPELGLFKKTNVSPKKYLREYKLDNFAELEVGSEIKCSVFKEGDVVDVTGTSKGHGFSGNIKRWNGRRLKMTHGTGPVHRQAGPSGANSTPSRVFKNHKMPGQFGVDKTTNLNLKVVKVDEDKNVLLIQGSIPGNKNGLVSIRSAVKTQK
ncbi:MAG: 50S ribosomal protein L3 [Clostridia bacterium]|nr:50S ribosomal protein L3 [Clostridia bacterium]